MQKSQTKMGSLMAQNSDNVHTLWTYRLPKGELVDVPGKHGACREDGGVCRWHDSCRHRTQAEKRHKWWAKVLEHDGEDHVCLFFIFRRNGTIRCLVPIWAREEIYYHLYRHKQCTKYSCIYIYTKLVNKKKTCFQSLSETRFVYK